MSDHNSPNEVSVQPLNVRFTYFGAAPIGMLLYPLFTLLDLAGPQTAFG